ncbi:sigma factor [Plantactinospora solaniradicis]|uniref:Sigma factor n=1 Tax=Plantactinospora solaniradicis TaxID=1723736 RepID=A0ABW1KIF4_9ACTN
MTFAEAIEGQPTEWVKWFAKRISPSSIDPEDLISEGIYGMWVAFEQRQAEGANLSSYLIQAARWQILRVLDRRKWTGQEKTRAPRGINSTGIIHPDEVEQFYPSDIMSEWDEVATDDGLERSDIADVRAEIRGAVAAIPNDNHRDKLFRKFWLDESVPLSGNWWRDPKFGARARLQESLSHLRSVDD